MRAYWLALGLLAVWRVAHLLTAEDGPGDLLVRLRRAAGTGPLAGLLDCFYCVSLWVALPLAWWIGQSWKERGLLWPALSAGAILLERLHGRLDPSAPAAYWEEEDSGNAVLRREENRPPADQRRRPGTGPGP